MHRNLSGSGSGTLLRRDDGKGGPALLDLLAAAVRAEDFSLFVVDEGQDLREGFLAIVAEEFVMWHTNLLGKGVIRGILEPPTKEHNMVFWRGTSGSTWRSWTYNLWKREEAVMPEPPYRALRIFLRVFSLSAGVGGLLMIFAEKPLIVRILLRPPEGQVSTLLLFLLKELGGMALMLGMLLWLASRNPVRNVAIVDGLIAGLCILAVTPVLSLWMTDIRSVYPAYLLWGRSAVRLAIGALLYWLRPREARWEPAGNF
jgi:hypothetical protein